jgi:YegS/Rv2252/BmrU family lipid kinase
MRRSSSPVAAIINPVAGPIGDRAGRAEGEALLRDMCASAQLSCEVAFTERAGHARDLASDFLGRGFSPIIAWGGDGTVNEVGSALAFQDSALAIVPAGSGNGLARELGISLDPRRAVETAVRGTDRTIDVGELGGRSFLNLAGIGLDAAVAFAFGQLEGRGLRRYVRATMSTVLRYTPEVYQVATETQPDAFDGAALLVELANGTQFGNGATIAPRARLDDGLLDVVIVAPRGAWRALWGARRLFNGTMDRDPGVQTMTARRITIAGQRPMRFHVDGEGVEGGATLDAVLHPAALRVRIPSEPPSTA